MLLGTFKDTDPEIRADRDRSDELGRRRAVTTRSLISYQNLAYPDGIGHEQYETVLDLNSSMSADGLRH